MKKFESLNLDAFKKDELTEMNSIIGSKAIAASTATNVGSTGVYESDYDPDNCESSASLAVEEDLFVA